MQWSVNLPGYNDSYQGAWEGSQQAQQGQINSGSAMWAQLIAQQQAAAAANNAHWQTLLGQTLGGLKGANKSNLQDIADKYTALSGQMSQQLIDRGLGNTTVQSSIQRGVAADRAKEATRSRNQFAQTIAGYQASLGGQGLQAEMSNNAMLANLGKGQIDWLTGINIGYPNRGDFASAGGYGGGGGGGTAFYPPMQGMHHFGSDVMAQGYDQGPSGGYAGGYGGAYSPTIMPAAGSPFDFAGAGNAIAYGAASAYPAAAFAQVPSYGSGQLGMGAEYAGYYGG